MRLFRPILTVATLGCYALAARLIIYTPADKPYTIVTLKSDWTIDRTSKQEFIDRDSSMFQHRKIPKGDDNDFAVTGVIDWTTDNFTEKRAFWISEADPPWGENQVIRFWAQVSLSSSRPMRIAS